MASSVWEEWLKSYIDKLNIPEYAKEVLRKKGIKHITQPCKGCIHLRRGSDWVVDQQTGKGKAVEKFTCTRFGGEQPWQPTWPACGGFGKVQR